MLGQKTLMAGLLACSACGPPLTQLVPVEGANSALVLGHSGAEPMLLALALDPTSAVALPESLLVGAPVHVAFLGWRLEELQLPEGLIILPSTGALDRAIPTPLATFEGSVGAAPAGWREVADGARIYDAIRLPSLDLPRCVSEGGCLARLEDRNLACTMPCPPPSEPTAPAEPSVVDAPIESPASPSPPVFEPCPAGWRSVAGEGDTPALCEPPAPPVPQACGPYEAQFYGQSTCTPIGPACPLGDFAPPPSGLLGPVFYVRPSGLPGGDGSSSAPFSSLAEALSQVPDDSVLLLSKGTFAERILLERPVTMIGACVEQTVVTHPQGEGCCEPILDAKDGALLDLRSLRFRGATALLGIGNGSVLRLEDVLFELETARSWAIVAAGTTTLSGLRLVVRGEGEEALFVRSGARVEIEQSVVEAGITAIRVEGNDSELQLRDLVVREPATSGMSRGILIFDGARLSAERVHIERAVAQALTVDTGASVEISDMSIASSLAASPNNNDVVAVRGGSVAVLDRASIMGGDTILVRLEDPDSVLELSRAVARGAQPSLVGADAGAFYVSDGRLFLDRVLIEDNASTGLRVDGSAEAILTDVVFRGNFRGPSLLASPGYVISASQRSRIELARGVIRENRLGGVRVFDAAQAKLTDVWITDQIRPDPEAIDLSLGILVQAAAQLELERAVIGSSDDEVLVIDGAVTATLSHTTVRARNPPRGPPDLVALNGATLNLQVFEAEGAPVHIIRSHLNAKDATITNLLGQSAAVTVEDNSELEVTRLIVEHPDPAVPTIHIESSRASIRDAWSKASFVYLRSSTVSLERVRIDGADLVVEGEVPLSATDLILRSALTNGINFGVDASGEIHRALLTNSSSRGIRLSENSRLTATDVVIEGAEVGLTAFDQAQLLLGRFRIADNQQVGLVFDPSVGAEGSRGLQLRDGEVVRQPVGLRRYEGYDLAEAMVRVRFEALATPIQ